MYFLIFVLPITVLGLSLKYTQVVNTIFFGETGFFEIAQFGVLFYLGILFFYNYYKNKKYYLLILGFIFFVGAMEEISWGQSLLHFPTFPIFLKINFQKENNLHNLIAQEFFNGSIFQSIYIFFIFIPLLSYFKQGVVKNAILPFLFSSSLQIYSSPIYGGLEKIEAGLFFFLYFFTFWVIVKSSNHNKLFLYKFWFLCGLNALLFAHFNKALGLKVYEIREFFIDLAILKFVSENRFLYWQREFVTGAESATTEPPQ